MASPPRKMILFNGRIHTMDTRQPIVEAVAICDGKFVAVGRHEEVLNLAGADVERIPLDGRTVVPGLIDSHIHFLQFALGLDRVDLEGVPSLAVCVEKVRERIERTERGGWIVGRGWNYNPWPEGRFPRKDDLDPISPVHPVVLSSKDGHLLWVNSKALEAGGIDRNTSDPSGGEIERDASGEPTGLIKENAGGAIWKVVPLPSEQERLEALRSALPIAYSKGLTGLHVPEGRDSWSAFQRLREEGALGLRVLMMIPAFGLDDAIGLGLRSGFGDAWLRIGPVKLFVDGALGGQTAAMIAPYEGDPDNSGILTMTEEEFGEVVARASAAGINVAVHAIGDRATRMVLDAVEASQRIIRAHRLRPRIEHAQLLRACDFGRLAELGVIASMQPIHATSDWRMADRHWGKRGKWAYAWRSVLKAGGRLAFGSDCPVETLDPLKGIYAAVTRKEENGRPEGGWYPEQCLTVEEAVRAYTMGAAFAAGEEAIKGSIAMGKAADLVVLSEDIFSDPPERILETKVEMTMVGGEIVYRGS